MTKPLENALSTLNGVKNVTSQSNENYSLLFLEYQDDTDMDSAMVKASTAVNQLGDALPDMASTPTLMEISPDMMATQYICRGLRRHGYLRAVRLCQRKRAAPARACGRRGQRVQRRAWWKSRCRSRSTRKRSTLSTTSCWLRSVTAWPMPKRAGCQQEKINDGMKELDAAQAQLDAGKAQLNSQKADVTTQLRDAITELDKQIPELEKKIASLQTDLDEANRKLENAKNTSTTLPEVTLPIDDALFASCKTVLAAYDPQYNADALPANLAEAKSDLNKMGAMVNSIDRADAAIRQRAADEGLLEQNMTVEQTAAYLDAQYAAMSARIQALEVEIASLQDSLNNTEDETERADLQAQIDAKRAEQAGRTRPSSTATPRRARVSELSGNLSTLSTTKVALQNATTLLTARQEAETALNDGMQPLQQTLNDTAARRDQLTKAQEMLTQLNEQRDKLQKCWQAFGDEAVDPAMADMAVQLLLSGTEAQLQLGEFGIQRSDPARGRQDPARGRAGGIRVRPRGRR